jgi:DNA-binding PadR family transcriptional regulator
MDPFRVGADGDGRKAKYYKLTAVGRKQLEEAEKSFEQLVKGVRAMFRYA